MKKSRWIQLGILLFISFNFLLVLIDDESQVDRVSYINSWSTSVTTDMKRELQKPVVLSAANEELIYFDRSIGIFQEFLVAEGEEVNEGMGLFTYRVKDFAQAESSISQHIDQINGEIEAIEQAITQMENYTVPKSKFNPDSSVLVTDDEIFVELPNSSIEAELMKEQYLVEKEKELTKKNLELTVLENQLEELQQTGEIITFNSPYTGKVKQIATDLVDPIITLESMELHAVGELSEYERTEVAEGMPAVLQMQEMDVLLEGTIDTLSESPAEIAVSKESYYPFSASLEGTDEKTEAELLPGYHGVLTITLEEVLDTTAIEEDALHKGSIWEMTTDGTLSKRTVETGLIEGNNVEIREGLEPDTLVAEGPVRHFREDTFFITPLKWKELNRDSFRVKETDWLQPFLSGILVR